MNGTERFPEEDLLQAAEREEMEALIRLDSAGFLLTPGEDARSYAGRIRAMRAKALAFQEKTANGASFEVYPGIVLKETERIPDEIMNEASLTTESLYGFSILWVPGYFLSKGLGLLWGGCALSDDAPDSVPVFIIRACFQSVRRWFIYSRDELLSHELCHAARAPLGDRIYEEHFAYAGSSSALRRYMGNCFQSDRDALFFLLPILLLLLVQILVNVFGLGIPSFPFWIAAFLYPGYLFFRNARQRKTYFKAENNLRLCGFSNPGAVLFRLTEPEIQEAASASPDVLKSRLEAGAKQEIRMRIILKRFLTEMEIKGETENADHQ